MRNSKKVAVNVLVSTGVQIITLVLGLVLPRIILLSWGSEYNGLINSITTVMQYLALLEAGIGTSTLQALYKSLGQNDAHQTSVVIKSSREYYKKVAYVYALAVIGVSTIYPLLLKTTIPYWEIFFAILLQGCTGVINLAFRAAYQQLLNAEGKYYIVALITLLTTVLTYSAKIIAVLVFDSIIVMQILGVIVMGVQILIYSVYFRKKYQWVDASVASDMELLKNRKHYLVQQIAGLVFNSTDILVLSIFCSLQIASVYSVYKMIYAALGTLIGILRHSTNFVQGHAFHSQKEEFAQKYRLYTSFQAVLGGLLASCSVVLMKGFVQLYTAGVTDAEYENYLAAVLFSVNFILDCARGASLAGANVAGRAPQTSWRYIAEAIINLGASLILVNIVGMNGVLLGTLIAGIWRTTDSIVFFNRRVLEKKPMGELMFLGVIFFVFSIYVSIGHKVMLPISDYLQFVFWGIFVGGTSIVLFGAIFYFANRRTIHLFLDKHKK